MGNVRDYNFKKPFDALNAAVTKHLFSTDLLMFKRECIVPGYVVYTMRTQYKGKVITKRLPGGYDWDGNMGKIELRDLGDKVKMTITCTPPNRDDGEGTYIQLNSELQTVVKSPAGTFRLRGPTSDNPYEELKNHQEWVINRLLYLLREDGIVPVSSDDEETTLAGDAEGNEPWGKIPDKLWHREALKFWWEGYTVPEIAKRLYLAPKTVRNKLSELRGTHGKEIVPTAAQLRKMKRR